MKNLLEFFKSGKFVGLFLATFLIGCNLNLNSENNQTGKTNGNSTSNSANNSQTTNRIDANRKKTEPTAEVEKELSDFVPKGWKIEDQQTGDLNNDSVPDLILQLLSENAKDEDYDRTLLILFKSQDGSLSKAVEAKKILRCSKCGGMLGTGLSEIKVEKGVLILDTLYGSRDSVNYILRFRYDAGSKKFQLIGEDIITADRAKGTQETTSINYLTNKKIVTKEVPTEATGEKTKVVSEKESKITPQKKYLEEIDYLNY
jgi:hypothetical protein